MHTVLALPAKLHGWAHSLSENGRDRKTIALYRTTVEAFLRWHGEQPMARSHLHAYVRFLQVEHRTPGADHAGLRPRTIRRIFTALRSFWAYAEVEGLKLPSIDAITLPRLDLAQRRVPTDSEVRAIFAASERVGREARTRDWMRWQRNRARCVLALFAGCALRRGELLALDVTDIRDTPNGWIVVVRRGKGGQSRTIPIAPEHVPACRDWLAVRLERVERLGHVPAPLFYEEKGARMGQHSIESLWAALIRDAGLEGSGLTPHSFRHWAASALIKRTSVKVAQVFLGHSTPAVTLSVYCHADADDMRNAAGLLAGTVHTPVEQPQNVSRRDEPTPARGPSRRVRRPSRYMLGR